MSSASRVGCESSNPARKSTETAACAPAPAPAPIAFATDRAPSALLPLRSPSFGYRCSGACVAVSLLLHTAVAGAAAGAAAAAGASVSPSRRRRLSLPSLLLSMTVLLFVFPGRRGGYKNLYSYDSSYSLSLDPEGQTQHVLVWNRQIKNSIHSPFSCFLFIYCRPLLERVRKPLAERVGPERARALSE